LPHEPIDAFRAPPQIFGHELTIEFFREVHQDGSRFKNPDGFFLGPIVVHGRDFGVGVEFDKSGSELVACNAYSPSIVFNSKLLQHYCYLFAIGRSKAVKLKVMLSAW